MSRKTKLYKRMIHDTIQPPKRYCTRWVRSWSRVSEVANNLPRVALIKICSSCIFLSRFPTINFAHHLQGHLRGFQFHLRTAQQILSFSVRRGVSLIKSTDHEVELHLSFTTKPSIIVVTYKNFSTWFSYWEPGRGSDLADGFLFFDALTMCMDHCFDIKRRMEMA